MFYHFKLTINLDLKTNSNTSNMLLKIQFWLEHTYMSLNSIADTRKTCKMQKVISLIYYITVLILSPISKISVYFLNIWIHRVVHESPLNGTFRTNKTTKTYNTLLLSTTNNFRLDIMHARKCLKIPLFNFKVTIQHEDGTLQKFISYLETIILGPEDTTSFLFLEHDYIQLNKKKCTINNFTNHYIFFKTSSIKYIA